MRTRRDLSPTEIESALEAHSGNVKAAAEFLGVSERTLYRRMAEFSIRAKVRYVREAA